MKAKRVFVYVQHLLGIGHLKRAAAIAHAMAADGLEVTLASGGMPVPGLNFDGLKSVQLPPAMAADSTFKVLLDANAKPIDEAWKQDRREALLCAWREAAPHALVFELYPFGRRQMRFELVPLLEAATSASHRPVIVSSVRDILGGGQKNPARQDEMLALFERYFDQLLVHGDPKLIPFERTFRHAGKLADKLHYTGYVVDRAIPRRSDAGSGGSGKGEVIVSAGGGAVGRRLLDVAIRARPLSRLADRTWRILVGVNADSAEFSYLADLAGTLGAGRVVVEPARADFVELLENCAVSVSQGGYNTVMEILQACARAVVVPFAGGTETEQSLRADVLSECGLIEKIDEYALDPESLAAAVDRAGSRPRGTIGRVDLDGARRAAALICDWTKAKEW